MYENLLRSDAKYDKYERVLLTIDPLRYDPISVEQSDIDNESFLEWLSPIYLKMCKDTKFEPNFPNANCKFCHITNLCPKYKELLKYDYKLKKTDKAMVEHLYEMQKIKPITEKALAYYKDYFKQKIDVNENNEIDVAGYQVGMSESRRFYIKKGGKRV
jgi:hypothetical protein